MIFFMDTKYTNRIHKEEGGVRPLSTVLKTLSVLDLLAEKSKGMRLVDVARELNLQRATAYQRLLTLVEAGWIETDDQGLYRLSMHATRIASAALEQADLGTRAESVMTHLVEEVRETASLAVLDRGQPCIISRVESQSLLRAEQKIGTVLSLKGSASGRALVAFGGEAMISRLRQNGHDLPDDAILEKIRTSGYAVSSGYTQSGVKGIAAPVFDLHDRCRATLSLVVPETRFDLERLKAPLLEAAHAITRILQGGK